VNEAKLTQERERIQAPTISAGQIQNARTNAGADIAQVPRERFQISSTALGQGKIENDRHLGRMSAAASPSYSAASEYSPSLSDANFNQKGGKVWVDSKTNSQFAKLLHCPQEPPNPRLPAESLPSRKSPVKSTVCRKPAPRQMRSNPHLRHKVPRGSADSRSPPLVKRPAGAKIEQSAPPPQFLTFQFERLIQPVRHLPVTPESNIELTFLQFARILRRSKGASDISYPVEHLILQNSTDFYRWYTDKLGVRFQVPVLQFELLDAQWRKATAFLVAPGNEFLPHLAHHPKLPYSSSLR
jgi:hypothetical protein